MESVLDSRMVYACRRSQRFDEELYRSAHGCLGACQAGTVLVRTCVHRAKPESQANSVAGGTASTPISAHGDDGEEEPTYLRNDQVLRELGKPNYMIEQLPLLPVIIAPRHKLKRVILSKRPLRSLLVQIRLAQNLRGIHAQLLVSRPCTVDNVVIDHIPRASVIAGIARLRTTPFPVPVAVRIADPYQGVRTRLEIQYTGVERVWWIRRVLGVPVPPAVGRVVVLCGIREQISTVVGMRVHVEGEESFVGELLFPGVSLVTGLPDRMIG